MGMSGIYTNIKLPFNSLFYGLDLEPTIVNYWNNNNLLDKNHKVIRCDYTGTNLIIDSYKDLSVFVHFDPPYRNTSSPKKYKHDFANDNGYKEFLQFVKDIDSFNYVDRIGVNSYASCGANSNFLTPDGKTITVTNGIMETPTMANKDIIDYVGSGYIDNKAYEVWHKIPDNIANNSYVIPKICIMVSHWQDDLFDKYLSNFVHIPFKTMTRGGIIDNGCYINYNPQLITLADYSYSGVNFTQRQAIKRKVDRNIGKFKNFSDLEKEMYLRELFKIVGRYSHS